jgi:hypothetical protein
VTCSAFTSWPTQNVIRKDERNIVFAAGGGGSLAKSSTEPLPRWEARQTVREPLPIAWGRAPEQGAVAHAGLGDLFVGTTDWPEQLAENHPFQLFPDLHRGENRLQETRHLRISTGIRGNVCKGTSLVKKRPQVFSMAVAR